MMVALLLFALVVPSSSADVARAHFTKAQRLFVDQRYKEALVEFEAAQHAAPHEVADLYFNIGQCNRNLGRVRPAIAAFERYLELKPDAPDRKQVRAVLLKLRAKLPADVEPDTPAQDGEAAPLAQVVASAVDERGTVEPAAATTPEPASEPPSAAPAVKLELPAQPAPSPAIAAAASEPEHTGVGERLYQKWWFWAGIGVAVIGTSAGLYAGLNHGSSGAPTMMSTPSDMLGSAGNFDTRGH